MWSIFTLIVLSAHLAMGWVSGGDKSDSALLASNRLSVTREIGENPLRILFELDPAATTASDSVSLADYPDINKIIESVQTYFSNSLCVKRVTSNIEISQSTCIGNGVTVNPITYSNVDVVIIIRGTNSPSTTTGFSQVAFLEAGNRNQPLVGVVSINKALFDSEPDLMRKWTFLAHLTIHVLGFSEALYPEWVNEATGLKWGAVWQYITVRGITKKGIITTKALNEARTVYNDPSIAGVELEEDLALGYRSEHWDARILFNDVSCVRSHTEMIISTITLAVLEDSGWYKTCGCKGTVPIFGIEYGCSFCNQACIEKTSVHGNLWCTSTKTGICDAFNLHKASCRPIKPVNHPYQMIPLTAEEYFGDSITGGQDRFTDFCPYAIPETNGNCRLPKVNPGFGETYGINSRCFEHTLELGVSGKYLSSVSGCFDVKCLNDGTAEVTISQTKVICPAAGGYITVPLSVSPSGWFKCPPNSSLCGSVPCLNACNGKGCCNNGVCTCFNGWSGPDCDTPCPSMCLVCPLGSCIECKEGFYLDPITKGCKKCPLCCETCSSETVCIKSIPGCNGITPICLDNCYNCTVPFTCITPNPGYCISKVSSNIQSCCEGCKTCAPDDCCNCVECLPGYMKTKIGTCTKSCVVNCLTCKTTTECLDCKVGYNLTPDGRCLRCPDGCTDCINKCTSDSCPLSGQSSGCLVQSTCDDNCVECATVECTACIYGYKMNPNKLCDRVCPLNCRKCNADPVPKCLLCNSGFYLNSINDPPTCDPCETSCISCERISATRTNCKTCRSGFFLRLQFKDGISENDCVDCETGCYSCTDEFSCSGCVARFYLKNLHCYRCEYGCRSCTDEFLCTQADPGFYVKSDGHVARCHKSCATCDADLICNTCMSGFFFYECSSENCLCRDCGDFCSKCSSPYECSVCKSGYYLDAKNACIVCDYYCSTCEMAGKCLTCRWGYYLKPDKTCGKCDVGCQFCVDFEHCKLCLGGFYPDEYFCNPCPFKCAFCWSPTQCYSCLAGWWLDKSGVPTCRQCPDTCIRCNNLEDCVLCKRTYFISQGICTKCGPKCAFCTSQTVCTICEMGFYLDKNSLCQPCQGGCLDCCDSLTCMKAKNGWWLQYFPTLYYGLVREAAVGSGLTKDDLGGYVASPCGYKCISCLKLEDCGACANGAYLVDGKECKDCKKTCSQCRSADNCSACVPRHYLKDSSCEECSSNCNACTETECTAPKTGFYKNPADPFKVLQCLNNCNACVGGGEFDCITCKPGFGIVLSTEFRYSAVVYTYKCDPCDTGCKTCNPRDSCTAAMASYYLVPADQTSSPVGSGPPSSPPAIKYKVAKCPSTCATCVLLLGVVTCQTCVSKNGLNGINCVPCKDPNCITCSPYDVCLVCASTYYLNSTAGCSKCVGPCNTCKDSVLCTSCLAPYYLPDPKVPSSCSNCMTNCRRCTTGDTCNLCDPKMYFNSVSKTCDPCPTNCTACIEVNSLDGDGNPIKLIQCTACASRCAVEGLLCLPCVNPYCLVCRPIGQCSQCQWGYYLDLAKDCIKCNPPCASCSSSTFCLSCAGATFLESSQSGSCKSCLPNCYKCTSVLDCSSVRTGYYLTGAGSSLANVTICPASCSSCKEVTIDGQIYVNCTTCKTNYILTLTSVPQVFKCCIPGCSTCENQLFCTSCVVGWSLNSAKLCLKCSNFCNTCSSSTKCSNCADTHFLYLNSYCCHKNCVVCNGAQICSKCVSGKLLRNGECIDCPPECTSCNNDICEDCIGGYYHEAGDCKKCGTGCKKCLELKLCLECEDSSLSPDVNGDCK